MDKVLHQIYYVEHNYDNANELYRKAKERNDQITLKYVKEWLSKQQTSQLTHRPVGKKQYLKIYSEDHYSFQMDLTFLPTYKAQNDNYYVLFTAININSRYAYVYYAKDKSTNTILEMLDMFMKDAVEVHNVTSDLGTEFTGMEVMKWFDKHKILMFFALGDSHKLGIINRFHRTLKSKLNKYFIASNSYRWIDVIGEIVDNYNHSINRGIGMTPTEASKEIAQANIISNAREHNETFGNNKVFNVGDKCRLKNAKELFKKFQLQYSNDIYTIVQVNKNTVDVSDGQTVFKNIKKDNIMVINNDTINNFNEQQKQKIEMQHSTNLKNKKEGVNKRNIIEDVDDHLFKRTTRSSVKK